MKSFFGSLLGKPAAEKANAALAWIDNLAELDEISALQKSTQQLAIITNDDPLSGSEMLRTILLVDQKNRGRISKITKQFVSFDTLKPELSIKIHETAYFYHRQLYTSYRNLINAFIRDNNQTSVKVFSIQHQKQFPLLVGRSMLAIYDMMRLRFYLQQSAADNAWIELFSLYKILEEHSLLGITLALYPEEPETNLSKSFIHACMLGNLDHGGMTKQQTELASQLLEKWSSTAKPSASYLPQRHLYYVDLNKDSTAKRIRHFTPTPTCRYWDIDQLSSKIKLAIASVEDNQPLEYLEIGELMHDPNLLDVLIIMRSEWSRIDYRRQRRSEERKKVLKSVTVTFGIESICQAIKSLGYNAAGRPVDDYSLDEKLMHARSIGRGMPNILEAKSGTEPWMINDESASGVGIVVKHLTSSEIKIGKILGLVIEGNRSVMEIGTIRSIKKLANGSHHIGVKILSRQAKVVRLKRLSTTNGYSTLMAESDKGGNPTAFFFGLYLAVESGLTIWPSLILPKFNFQASQPYEITHADKKLTVNLSSSTESKDDWVKVSWPD